MRSQEEIENRLKELRDTKKALLQADGDHMAQYEQACEMVRLLEWVLNQ